MIEDFSSGYYRADMVVQAYDDGPVIERGLYNFITDELFFEDSPLMMRLSLSSEALFDVQSESSVPRDVLAVPEEIIAERGAQSVYILKPEYSETVGAYHG
jgi:hypothetical protein